MIKFWSMQAETLPLLSKLAIACLTMPYSTASIERSFSTLRDIRRAKRNRLNVESVEACMLVFHKYKSIDDFEVTSEMLEMYKTMWKKIEDDVIEEEVKEGAIRNNQNSEIEEEPALEERKYDQRQIVENKGIGKTKTTGKAIVRRKGSSEDDESLQIKYEKKDNSKQNKRVGQPLPKVTQKVKLSSQSAPKK